MKEFQVLSVTSNTTSVSKCGFVSEPFVDGYNYEIFFNMGLKVCFKSKDYLSQKEISTKVEYFLELALNK